MSVLARFEAVTKRYRRGRERGNLRAALPGAPGNRVLGETMTALDNVSLELCEGDALGVIGPNGAGKSTLLKLLARVIAPTSGRVTGAGRVASLLDLGAGFHPDLTGIENAEVAAALLGMNRAEFRRKWDDIVAFAGIEPFLDTPVKRYSTGMRARLGFALASHVDASVLAVDEVLAVGDAEFQNRCYERCRHLLAEGVGMVLVSHNLWVVAQVCTRVLRLDRGRVVDEGPPLAVIERYTGSAVGEAPRLGASPVVVDGLVVDPPIVDPCCAVEVQTVLHCHEPVPAGLVTLSVIAPGGYTISEERVVGGTVAMATPGVWRLRGQLNSLPFTGRFTLAVSALEVEGRPPLSRATTVLDVAGPVSTAPRLVLDTTWSIARIDADGRDCASPPAG